PSAEHQGLLARCTHLLNIIEALQAETNTHWFVQTQPETGIQHIACTLAAVLQQAVDLSQRFLCLLAFLGGSFSRTDSTAQLQLALTQTAMQFTPLFRAWLHSLQLLIELQAVGAALMPGAIFSTRLLCRLRKTSMGRDPL